MPSSVNLPAVSTPESFDDVERAVALFPDERATDLGNYRLDQTDPAACRAKARALLVAYENLKALSDLSGKIETGFDGQAELSLPSQINGMQAEFPEETEAYRQRYETAFARIHAQN